MSKHSEILSAFKSVAPEFDFSNADHKSVVSTVYLLTYIFKLLICHRFIVILLIHQNILIDTFHYITFYYQGMYIYIFHCHYIANIPLRYIATLFYTLCSCNTVYSEIAGLLEATL